MLFLSIVYGRENASARRQKRREGQWRNAVTVRVSCLDRYGRTTVRWVPYLREIGGKAIALLEVFLVHVSNESVAKVACKCADAFN
jgi:hypothetical protein